MKQFLRELRALHKIGFVGGSNLDKQKEQLGEDGESLLLSSKKVLSMFDYCFPENGLVAYKEGELLAETCIKKIVPREDLNEFISWCLRYIADLNIPLKTYQ